VTDRVYSPRELQIENPREAVSIQKGDLRSIFRNEDASMAFDRSM
jgi:hypothetical protein